MISGIAMALDESTTVGSTAPSQATTVSCQVKEQPLVDRLIASQASAQANSYPQAKPTLSTFKGFPRDQQQQQQQQWRRPRDDKSRDSDLGQIGQSDSAADSNLFGANSLESISSSRYSSSSANETTSTSPNQIESSQRALIGTRVVSPPRLASDQVLLESDNNSDDMKAASADSQTGQQHLEPTLPRQLDVAGKAVLAAGADKAPPLVQSLGKSDSAYLLDPSNPGHPRLPDTDLDANLEGQASRPPFMFAGIASSIAASFFFSLNILCVKLLPGSGEEGFEHKTKGAFARGFIMLIMSALTIVFQRSTFRVPRDELWINILRSIFGTVGSVCSYVALNYISMGDAAALIFSSPVWTSLLSHFILGEPLRWITFLAIPACAVGIVLIAHPSLIVNVDHLSVNHHAMSLNASSAIGLFNGTHETDLSTMMSEEETMKEYLEGRWPGIVICLFTSLVVSLSYIVLKFRKRTPIQTTTFWLGVCMTATSMSIMFLTGSGSLDYSGGEWLLLLAIGVTSWIAQLFLQWAFLHEEAGVLSIVRTLDVALNFILSALFLDDDIYWTSIVGATIISLVVVSFMLNNWFMSRADTSSSQAQNVVIISPSMSQKEAEANLSNSQRPDLTHRKQVHTSGTYMIDKIA